jgi:hypothetical protein
LSCWPLVRRPARRAQHRGCGHHHHGGADHHDPSALTAKELAWLKAIPTVGRTIEKSIEAISNLTPSAMARLANTFRSCTRELVRGGPPGDRLKPVYVLVKKACKEYDKGAACFATAASVGIPFAGTPGERT